MFFSLYKEVDMVSMMILNLGMGFVLGLRLMSLDMMRESM